MVDIDAMSVDIVPALKEHIAKRCKDLGLSPTEFARAAGVTTQGLVPLRRGERRAYQVRLTGPVCRALQWRSDSIDRILAGKKPIKMPRAASSDTGTVSEFEALRARVDLLEKRFGAPGPPPDDASP